MKANEALRLSRNSSKFKTVVPGILDAIKAEAMEGKTRVFYHVGCGWANEDIDNYVHTKISGLGYGVKTEFVEELGRLTNSIAGWTISWEGPC